MSQKSFNFVLVDWRSAKLDVHEDVSCIEAYCNDEVDEDGQKWVIIVCAEDECDYYSYDYQKETRDCRPHREFWHHLPRKIVDHGKECQLWQVTSDTKEKGTGQGQYETYQGLVQDDRDQEKTYHWNSDYSIACDDDGRVFPSVTYLVVAQSNHQIGHEERNWNERVNVVVFEWRCEIVQGCQDCIPTQEGIDAINEED